MKLLNRNDILNPRDLPFQDVPLPELGPEVGVRVRTLTSEQLEEYQNTILNARSGKAGKRVDLRGSTARLLVLCVVDETGEPLFTEADIMALNKQSARTVQTISNVAMELNGLKEADLEGLVKN